MTPAQVVLLKKLINADRRWRLSGGQSGWGDRGVEVGWINGVSPKTARALDEAGLIEIVDRQAYLGSYDPNTIIEEKP